VATIGILIIASISVIVFIVAVFARHTIKPNYLASVFCLLISVVVLIEIGSNDTRDVLTFGTILLLSLFAAFFAADLKMIK
jgi:drug/metabolite transporter (DMT)-like permease